MTFSLLVFVLLGAMIGTEFILGGIKFHGQVTQLTKELANVKEDSHLLLRIASRYFILSTTCQRTYISLKCRHAPYAAAGVIVAKRKPGTVFKLEHAKRGIVTLPSGEEVELCSLAHLATVITDERYDRLRFYWQRFVWKCALI